jgi:hypothetical protein
VFSKSITHVTTIPYNRPALLAERVNRNLKSTLKIFHHASQSAWDEGFAWLSLAFNTAVHGINKCTPDKLFLGRELKYPLLVRWNLSPVSTNGTWEANQSFWTQASRNVRQARSKVFRRYDANHKPQHYQVGDTVFFRLNTASSNT